MSLRLFRWLRILTVARLSHERRYDANMRIGPRRPNRAGKNNIDELRNACPPRALALPLICWISARPIGSSPIEITPIPVFLERARDFRIWHKADSAGRPRQVRLRRQIGRSAVIRHRFCYVAFESPDGQILMNVVSRDRLIV